MTFGQGARAARGREQGAASSRRSPSRRSPSPCIRILAEGEAKKIRLLGQSEEMSSDGKGGGILIENLLAMLLSGKLSESIGLPPAASADPSIESLRSELRRSIQSSPQSGAPGSAPGGNGAGA